MKPFIIADNNALSHLGRGILGQKSGPIFAICGPKLTTLSRRGGETLQFAMPPFCHLRYFVAL